MPFISMVHKFKEKKNSDNIISLLNCNDIDVTNYEKN